MWASDTGVIWFLAALNDQTNIWLKDLLHSDCLFCFFKFPILTFFFFPCFTLNPTHVSLILGFVFALLPSSSPLLLSSLSSTLPCCCSLTGWESLPTRYGTTIDTHQPPPPPFAWQHVTPWLAVDWRFSGSLPCRLQLVSTSCNNPGFSSV